MQCTINQWTGLEATHNIICDGAVRPHVSRRNIVLVSLLWYLILSFWLLLRFFFFLAVRGLLAGFLQLLGEELSVPRLSFVCCVRSCFVGVGCKPSGNCCSVYWRGHAFILLCVGHVYLLPPAFVPSNTHFDKATMEEDGYRSSGPQAVDTDFLADMIDDDDDDEFVKEGGGGKGKVITKTFKAEEGTLESTHCDTICIVLCPSRLSDQETDQSRISLS